MGCRHITQLNSEKILFRTCHSDESRSVSPVPLCCRWVKAATNVAAALVLFRKLLKMRVSFLLLEYTTYCIFKTKFIWRNILHDDPLRSNAKCLVRHNMLRRLLVLYTSIASHVRQRSGRNDKYQQLQQRCKSKKKSLFNICPRRHLALSSSSV